MLAEPNDSKPGLTPLALVALPLLAVFLLDLAIPAGFAVGVLYVFPVLLALWRLRVSAVFAVTGIATVLIFIGLLENLRLDPLEWSVFSNRAVAILALWATALLGVRLRRTTEQLRGSESQIRAIVDTAVDAIITIDRQGVVQSFNRAAERKFGYAADEVIGRNVKMLMPSPYRDEHDDYLRRYFATGEARIIGIGREVTAQRKDGSTFPIDLAVSKIDRFHMFTGFIRDISDRKLSEEQLRQNERLSSIGTLAAGLGHDMHNVLLPVRSRLDVLGKTDLPENVTSHLGEIRKSVKYLQQLADGLHLLSLDPDDDEASTETTALTEWWEQVQSLLGRAMPKHVRFASSIARDLPSIPIAPHRFTQAVLNLLVNSASAVGDEGKVRLWAKRVDEVVQLGVTDNGCGMTEEVKRRALEPFFTTKKRGLGTGLGLSLVHGVVRSAGGAVEIDSAPGRGTTITLNFPIHEPLQRNEHADADAPSRGAIPAHVSVQDARLRSLVTSLLQVAGCEVCEPNPNHSAESAVWIVESARADTNRIHGLLNVGAAVIILGAAPEVSREPGVLVVDDPNDFSNLQTAIGDIVDRFSK